MLHRLKSSKIRKIYKQHENVECGLACIAMMLSYFGNSKGLHTLRKNYGHYSSGMNMVDLQSVLSKEYISSRALRISLSQLKNLQLPAIIHWNMDHFVILESVQRDGSISIVDPAIGRRKVTVEEVDTSFTGVALECSPLENFEKFEDTSKLKITDLWSKASGIKRSLAIIISLSIVLQIFLLLTPYYGRIVIDSVLVNSDTSLLKVLASAFLALVILDTLINAIRQILVIYFGAKLNIDISSNIKNKLIGLPINFFSSRHLGDVVSRFSSIENVKNFISQNFSQLIIDGFTVTFTMAAMMYYNVTLGFIVLAASIIFIFSRIVFYRPFRNASEQHIIKKAETNSHFMESVRAIQTIKLYGSENERLNTWKNQLVSEVDADNSVRKWKLSFESVNRTAFGVENVLVIYIAAQFVLQGEFTVGMLFAFLAYKMRFTSSLDNLVKNLVELKLLDVHLERISDFIMAESDSDEVTFTNSLDSYLIGEDIRKFEVKNIRFDGFKNKNSAPILDGINLLAQQGETIAIIGASGSGKSTLLQCLTGLLEPSEGQILVNDLEIKNVKTLRRLSSAVLQGDSLFQGSLADNLANFSSKIDRETLLKSTQAANIHSDIMAMPMRYETQVGDMGINMSAGQKQRVLLAKALYKRPKLLILDEATSHLDTKNEDIVNENIRSLGIIKIVVAHRPSTIQSADRVYKLNDGKLTEVKLQRYLSDQE